MNEVKVEISLSEQQPTHIRGVETRFPCQNAREANHQLSGSDALTSSRAAFRQMSNRITEDTQELSSEDDAEQERIRCQRLELEAKLLAEEGAIDHFTAGKRSMSIQRYDELRGQKRQRRQIKNHQFKRAREDSGNEDS